MKKILFLFAIILLLAGCSSEDNQSDGLYIDRDAVHDLTIMVLSEDVAFLRHMANRFAQESGLNINFDFQTYDPAVSILDRQALVTRLIGSDIDIFINGLGGFPTAGFNSSTIFTNLNDFIDSEYGLDRENYFDHILRASEQNGNLYFMPIYIRPTGTGLISMNTYYANQINFSLDGITTLTTDEMLNLWQEVANLNPDREILLDNFFYFPRVIVPNGSVDIDNVYVNINNPEAIRRVELAIQIPTRRQFTPEHTIIWGGSPGDIIGEITNLAPSSFFSPFVPKLHTLFHAISEPLAIPWFSLVDGYESHKILPIDREGEGFFVSVLSFGVLNDSNNQNLSLEFMRFLLDTHAYEATAEQWDFHYFRAGIWEGEQEPTPAAVPYSHMGIAAALSNNTAASIMLRNFHINREVFSQFSQNMLRASYLELLRTGTIEFESIEAMNSTIDSAFQNYKNIIYLLNRSFNIPPTQDILHAQNFLLYSGHQSIEETLINIQNMLEIFVAEQGGF